MWRYACCFAFWLLLRSVLTQSSVLEESSTSKLKINLNYFEMCPDHLDVPSTYDNLSVTMDPDVEDTLFVDGVLNMKKTIPNDTLLLIDMRRCLNKNRNSCEKYLINEIPDICSFIGKKGEFWSSFIDQIKGLKQECPIPPGSYQILQAPLKISFLEDYKEFMGHWQVEMSFVSPSHVRYGCLLLDLTAALKRT